LGEEAEPGGDPRRLGPGPGAELGEDGRDVVLHRLRREGEPSGDLGVPQVGGEGRHGLKPAAVPDTSAA
jgi:hypothetical protein